MRAYLNGAMVELNEARVSLEDAGFQHAVGLFETMSAKHGRVFRLQAHLDRLRDSAIALGLATSLDTGPLAQATQRTLRENQLSEARLRLTYTPGSVSLLRGGGGESQPTVSVVASEPVRYDPAYFERGISVLVAPQGANPFDALAGHKTLAYWGRLRTLRQAASLGAGEAIWLSVTNHLASGAVSNLFLVKKDTLQTPIARGEEVAGALPAPVLPGVTRSAVIELATKRGLTVQRRMLSIADLLEADEVFLTNSSWHILPVTKVEKSVIAGGEVGQTTATLRRQLLALIDQETQAPESR